MRVAFQSAIPMLPRSRPRTGLCPSRAHTRASIGSELETALSIEFANENVQRVIDSFRAVRSGQSLEEGANTKSHQRAHSFIEGLSATPFHDREQHPWAMHLEENWEKIASELREMTAREELLRKGTNVWAKPVVEEANAYGPDWRTLVLQDRDWDPVNSKLFPVTSALLRDEQIGVPSVEAFFARQSPSSGIKLHTDDCNFILTMHLGLDVPKEQSWIEVGGERRYWENGKCLIFDTSFFHQTMNESESRDRTVLLIRFWHPELTMVERKALQFLFRAIENPANIESVMKAREQLRDQRRQKAAQGMFDAGPDLRSRAERRKNISSAGKKANLKQRQSKGGGGFGKR